MILLGLALATGSANGEASPRDAGAAQRWTSHLFAAAAADAEPAKKPCACKDPPTRADRMRCFPQLVVHDAGWVFSAPARWTKKDWGLFATGALGVGLLLTVDGDIRTFIQENGSAFGDHVAHVFEPFGTWASFVVVGGFYVGGLAAHDRTAHSVAIDGLAASAIASLVITPTLKWMVGRSRPNAELGPHHFEPFHGGPAFPSGHATQAFAVASVIATKYKKPWVSAACYVPASLVLYARMRHDAHWASDVTAGALIGYGVGSEVVHVNDRDRVGAPAARLQPLVGPRTTGILLVRTF